MTFLRSIWQDLKVKRLWPVAAGLLLAIVAVPVVLSSSPAPATPAPVVPPAAPVSGLPAVSAQTGSSSTGVKGPARDPFASQGGSAPSTGRAGSTLLAGSATPGSGVQPGSGSASGTGTGPAPGSIPSGSGPGTPSTPSAPPAIHSGKPTPTLARLRPKQSYSVKLAITNSSGGVNTIDGLTRLSELPSQSRPLLIELGVLKGGKRVLFAVQPGATVRGPGACIPGPIDCQILSLGQDQTETLGAQGRQVALFSVTGIAAATHSSASAARQARRAAFGPGQNQLRHSALTALSLFQYDAGAGVVLDLRNLIVGSN